MEQGLKAENISILTLICDNILVRSDGFAHRRYLE